MSVKEAIADTVASLSEEEQEQVLNYARSLQEPPRPDAPPRRRIRGALSHLPMGTITEEDIRAMRREVWKNFPREEG